MAKANGSLTRIYFKVLVPIGVDHLELSRMPFGFLCFLNELPQIFEVSPRKDVLFNIAIWTTEATGREVLVMHP